LIVFNRALGMELGIDAGRMEPGELCAWFSGNAVPPGLTPLAMAYAGHQFGHFVPQLGDGRALLLGEARDAAGDRHDVQLKGSGRTPYSRSGDGRAALGPVLREYLVSEAMHALGISTTRALAAVTTGETVYRERPLPGAIVTRVAASHVRVGTFEFFAARGDIEALRLLADYVISRHYPEVRSAANPYLALLEAIVDRQASLVAGWMQVGFIHGVMNTDNMAVSGQTIDFGPCAFLDAYAPDAVFSSIDRHGRYAFGNQPRAAAWNLARLAEALLPVIDVPEKAIEPAQRVLAEFSSGFASRWLHGMRRKLGLVREESEDAHLAAELLDIMHRDQADFTLTFRALCDAAGGEAGEGGVHAADAAVSGPALVCSAEMDAWRLRWRARLARESVPAPARAAAMRQVNPLFIPRNHRIEQAIVAATEADDFKPFEALCAVLSNPYGEQPRSSDYALPPRPAERVLQTFCGT
jgi:uncharacterized protein YdiU (UPF0061 family)